MRKMNSILKISLITLVVSSAQASAPEEEPRTPSRIAMMSSSDALNLGEAIVTQIEQLSLEESNLKNLQTVLTEECNTLKQQKQKKETELNKLNPNNKKAKPQCEKLENEIKALAEAIKNKNLELRDVINNTVVITNKIKELRNPEDKNGWDGGDLGIPSDESSSKAPTPSPSPSPSSSAYQVPSASTDKGKEEFSSSIPAAQSKATNEVQKTTIVPAMIEVPVNLPETKSSQQTAKEGNSGDRTSVETQKQPIVQTKAEVPVKAVETKSSPLSSKEDEARDRARLAAIEAEAQNPDRKASSVGWVETACNAVVNTGSDLKRGLYKLAGVPAPLFPVGSYPTLTLSDIQEKFTKEWTQELPEEQLKGLKRHFLLYEFPPFFINSSISNGKYFLPHGFYYGTVKIELADVDLKLQLARLNLDEPQQDRTKLSWYKTLLKRATDASQLEGYVVSYTDKTLTCGPYEYLQRIIRCVEDTRTESMFVNFQNSRRPSSYESTKTLMEMDFMVWDEELKTIIFWGLCGLREKNELKGERDYLTRQTKAKERRQVDWPMLGHSQ